MDSTNTFFILLCSLLVLLMTPSLAMFYSGMVRHKNTLNTIMNCFVVFGVITFQWIFIGFTLAFGEDSGNGIIGNLSYAGFMHVIGFNDSGVPDILFAIFQMMFAIIAAAIITGSLVGRVKFGVLIVFLIFWSTFVYDILAHMIWHSDGFLRVRGSLDFAGGGVVHVSSGVAGLVGAILVGARKNTDSKASPHSIPYAFLGAILLFIGWLGFNAGSAGGLDMIAVNAFIVTITSAASGFLAWVLIEWIKHKRPTLLGALSGLVAGLVGITPACGFVSINASIIIGFISALLCYSGISFIKYQLKCDDSLDAFGLHGIGGIWGGIATGLFANHAINPTATGDGTLGEGLFISGSWDLLFEQCLAVFICTALSAVVSFIIFKVISIFTSLRVREEIENHGLDSHLHGEEAYSF